MKTWAEFAEHQREAWQRVAQNIEQAFRALTRTKWEYVYRRPAWFWKAVRKCGAPLSWCGKWELVQYEPPPAHPNCRCMPTSHNAKEGDDDSHQ